MNEISINDSNIMNSDNKTEENFYYFKLVYIISTTIICFLGILIIVENSNILIAFSKNKTENLVLFYIVYCSFSWLIIYLLAIIIFKIAQLIFKRNKKNVESEEDELELKYITNQNTILNKSNYLSENMINNNFPKFNSNDKDLELNNFEKNKDKIASTNNISNLGFSGNQRNYVLKTNLIRNNLNNNNSPDNENLEKSNRNHNFISSNNNTFLNHMQNPAYKLKMIYLILMLVNYSVFTVFGAFVFVKVLKEEVFKNYKLHYKIYLFLLLSLSKSSIIVIGFVYKFVSKKIESNSVKFELNEEFLQQIEREIQEANKISGIISPDRNLIKYNDMFNRQDLNKNSNFLLNDSPIYNPKDPKLDKNSTENLIEKDKYIDLNIHKSAENEKENNVNSNFIKYNNNSIKAENNDKARNIFNFKIKDNAEATKNNNINNNESERNKKINFKMNSDFNFNQNKDSAAANSFKSVKDNPEKINGNYRKSFTNEFNSKKNILAEDYGLINSKIDLEKLEPSKKLQELNLKYNKKSFFYFVKFKIIIEMQQHRDSKFQIQEEKKNEIKEQIKDSYLNNNNPQKNKMLEFKKKLEMLKKNEINAARSPKILKSSKGKKIFFDEKLEEKDFDLHKLKLEESFNGNNINISEFKFPVDKENNKIENINDFIKIAKRISKDDFNQSSYQINAIGNVSKR